MTTANLDRRHFLKTASLSAAALALPGFANAQAPANPPAPKKPNFLLIIGDDMTWWDCQPYGSTQVKTPNLQKLADQGLCLDAMFTSTAMCAPTRQQLYTGLYPVRNGAYPNHSHVHDGVRSLPVYLEQLGYRTALIGKKHFGPPEAFPFENLGGRNHDNGRGQEFDFENIREFFQRDPHQPFCLVLASNQPHGPLNRSLEDVTYDADDVTVPPNLLDCPVTREQMTAYFAEISYLDDQVGKCLKILDETGHTDDTLACFTSEQGAGSAPFGGKWTCYDSGLKTAFITRWPGRIAPGSRSNAMTQYVDVVPTFLEAAGADPKNIDTSRPDPTGYTGFDGRSFLKVLLGQTDSHRDLVFGIQTNRGIIAGPECYPIRSVRNRRYKYIWNLSHESTFTNVVTEGKVLKAWQQLAQEKPELAARVNFYQHRPEHELYDLEKDPYELDNLANSPEHAHIQTRLRKALLGWMRQQNDHGIKTEMQALARQGKEEPQD